MKIIKNTLAALTIAAIMAACGENSAKAEADKLLEQAETEFDNKQYDKALSTIDSLRKVYPNAIETRKKALVMHQNIALKQAQADLAHTDSMMQAVTHNYNYQKAKVEKDKKELRHGRRTTDAYTYQNEARLAEGALRRAVRQDKVYPQEAKGKPISNI